MEIKMETLSDEFICKKCNKTYKNRSGLWKHHMKQHISVENQPKISQLSVENQPNINKLNCKHCQKTFKHTQSRWKHEKICKYNKLLCDALEKDKIIEHLLKENAMFKEELLHIKELLNKHAKIHPKTLQKMNKQCDKNINNTSINNGNIGAVGNNNKVIHNTYVKFGDVKLGNLLDEKQILSILKKQFFSLEESIKMIHFNENLPQGLREKI